VRELQGRFGKPGRTVTLEEMDAAMATPAIAAACIARRMALFSSAVPMPFWLPSQPEDVCRLY
jgi:hypothetical protein